MELKSFNLLIVGVGGQGVISAVQILAWAALLDNYKVRTAETHGMAQRGGSVSSFLRFGNEVEGPLIPSGCSQVIIALEASEAVRNFRYANSNTIFLINNKVIIPPTVHLMNMEYPDIKQIGEFLNNVSQNIYFINADEMAMNLGNPRTMNVVMLGVLLGSQAIPLKRESLVQAILSYLPTKVHDVNKKAFQVGIEKGKNIRRDFNE